jgi:hypothetical protein
MSASIIFVVWLLSICKPWKTLICDLEMERVYCEVRTEYLYIIQVTFGPQSLRLLFASVLPRKPRFDPRSVHVRFVMDKMAVGQVSVQVLCFSLVSIIPPMFHTHLQLKVALTRRTNGRSLGTFHKVMLFRKPESTG